jgi:hypothetical protein
MMCGRRSECEVLDGLLANARAGHSGVLVLRGEAGVVRVRSWLSHLRPQRIPGMACSFPWGRHSCDGGHPFPILMTGAAGLLAAGR